jgi:hypothetical protein
VARNKDDVDAARNAAGRRAHLEQLEKQIDQQIDKNGSAQVPVFGGLTNEEVAELRGKYKGYTVDYDGSLRTPQLTVS